MCHTLSKVSDRSHALTNYYDNIDVQINYANKNNNKLSIGAFHIKPSTEIPTIQCISNNEFILSDYEENSVLNEYFSSVWNIDDTGVTLHDNYMLYDDIFGDSQRTRPFGYIL